MKRLIALLMASTLFLTACNSGMKNEDSNKNDSKIVEDVTSIDDIDLDINPETFSDLSDENLLQYVEDEVYAGITEQLASEDYIVESVDAIYISKEYLEEVEYNSQENIYFGYTLSELDAQYDGTRYVFTLGDDGQTTTKTFEKYDDTYEQVIKNVAIGNNLPAGSTQEIVLDVRGRGFSKDVIDNVVANIQSRCAPVYKDIPVTVMSY